MDTNSNQRLQKGLYQVYLNSTQLHLIQTNLCFSHLSQNQSVWHTLNLISFSGMLKKILEQYLERNKEKKYYLLSYHQEVFLANKVIASVIKNNQTIEISTQINQKNPHIAANEFLAARVKKAHYFLVDDEKKWAPKNQKIFNQLNALYVQALKGYYYLDQVALIELLIKQVKKEDFNEFQFDLSLIDFTQLSPLEIRLIKQLFNQSLIHPKAKEEKQEKENSLINQKTTLFQASQKEQEFYFAVTQLLAYQKNHKEDLLVCAYIPNTKINRLIEQLIDTFSHSFSHQGVKTKLSSIKEWMDVFILLKFMIKKSINLMELVSAFKTRSFYHLSLNQKPFIQSLNQIRKQNIHLDDWLKIVANSDEKLAKIIREFAESFSNHHQRDITKWSQLVSDLLFVLKWQVSDESSDKNRQNWQKLHEVLDESSKLDLFKEQVFASTFLEIFNEIMKKTTLNTKAVIERILFLPIDDIAAISQDSSHNSALHFDAIWLLGMDDTFGEPINSNPLLNYKEQRQKIANTNELQIYKNNLKKLHSFKKHVPIIGISFSLFDDELNRQVNPMIGEIFNCAKLVEIEDQTFYESAHLTNQRELFEPDNIKVNKAILNQATVTSLNRFHCCNFLGFAERVFFNDEQETITKPSAKERGILVHQMIENFFHQVPSYSILNEKIQSNQIGMIKSQSINLALKTLDGFSSIYIDFEKELLGKMLDSFIQDILPDETGKKSAKMYQVLALEEKIKVSLPFFSLRGKIDRIEKENFSHSEKLSVVDLKTGRSSTNLESIQLILYYWMIEKLRQNNIEVQGVDHQKIDEVVFQHLYLEKNEVKVVRKAEKTADLDIFLPLIDAFIDSFQSGQLMIRYDDKICKDCKFRSLCRIDEREIQSTEPLVN